MDSSSLEELQSQRSEYREALNELDSALNGCTDQDERTQLLIAKKEVVEMLRLLEEVIQVKSNTINPYLSHKIETPVIVPKEEGKQIVQPVQSSSSSSSSSSSDLSSDFYESSQFTDPKIGFVFKQGPRGLGYYRDSKFKKSWFYKHLIPDWTPDHDQLVRLGIVCSAQFEEDGNWYDASIDHFNENDATWSVTFIGYGNTQICKANQIKSVEDSRPKKRAAKEEEEINSNQNQKKDFVIPPSLKVLPTDSEEIRQEKKRRINAMKSQFRLKRLEEERTEKKNAWQAFNERKKNTSGSGKTPKSIFASPETIEGRVGVLGSGKTPTPIQLKPVRVLTSKKMMTPNEMK